MCVGALPHLDRNQAFGTVAQEVCGAKGWFLDFLSAILHKALETTLGVRGSSLSVV